jgi:3-oxoacyl-[acyl-carrier protein] reductase
MYAKEQAIVISGGSRGLGLHLASRFLDNGNRVATFARTRTDAVDRLISQHGDGFYFAELDASESGSLAIFFGQAVERFGRIVSVINNAAVGQDQLLMHCDVESIRRIVDINVIGTTLLTRLAVRHMLLEGGGNICNISSICGSRGYAGLTVYAGSKGYMDALTRSLVREVGERNIRINCVAPGFFESEMSSVLLPDQMETIRRRTPSGRLSNDEDIFEVVDLVISGITNIQGQVIFVDGGITS